MIKYSALHPATFKLDGGAMFGIIPKPLWEKQIPSDELNRIHLSLRVLCIQTENRVILVDSGIGDYHDSKFSQRFAIQGGATPLVNTLKEAQIKIEDVTDIVITHLHFDHVGGLGSEAGNFLFPNAKLHLHKSHYEYSLSPTQRDTGSFQTEYFKPVIEQMEKAKRIVWHEGPEGKILTDGNYQLNFRCSHGHTPWLMHPFDTKMIYMADLVPTSAHVPIAWVMGYDIAPGITTINKADFYQFISEKNLSMIFEHDIKFWGCKISWDGHNVKPTEKFDSLGVKYESLAL
ncbi:MAG: MBL fold metallo-hydrolase [Bacteriovoracaceae bacterium]|nr:MBL fold metallo-hydrolase [Bacteriovoracaceae bacterium]